MGAGFTRCVFRWWGYQPTNPTATPGIVLVAITNSYHVNPHGEAKVAPIRMPLWVSIIGYERAGDESFG